MKTVSKKLLSLLLVAMLLVSAVPFQALAADGILRVSVFDNATGYPVEDVPTVEVSADATAAQVFAAYQAQGGTGTLVSYEEVEGEMCLLVSLGATNDGGNEDDDDDDSTTTGGSTGATTVTMTLIVYDKNDNKVETKTANVAAADVLAWQDDVRDNLADILATFGSAYSASQVESGYANSNQVVLMLKNVVAPDEGENVVPGVILKTDYCGNIPASIGDKYLDVLPTPEKPGQEFAYWYSENLGGIVKAGDVVEGNDTLTAYWKSATKYNLTLDPNRGLAEDVNFGVQVTYGEAIYSKVMRYQPEREGYVFEGWKLNGKIIKADTIYELQGDATAYASWKLESDTEDETMNGGHTKDGKVYLEIYVNGDTANLKKRVDITSYAADDKITRAEAQAVVKKYVTAKAGYSLAYEGLFDEETWWWYTRDPETNGKDTIIVNRDGDDYVYVMVKNVKVVAADSTNPKTGDYVLPVSMTVMMLSGLAAAAVYVIGKKRRV